MSGAQINFLEEIIVDNFAGGGGASTGIELATGRPVTIAINHDPDAILMHKTNHPSTRGPGAGLPKVCGEVQQKRSPRESSLCADEL